VTGLFRRVCRDLVKAVTNIAQALKASDIKVRPGGHPSQTVFEDFLSRDHLMDPKGVQHDISRPAILTGTVPHSQSDVSQRSSEISGGLHPSIQGE
jgi:hypothetical protein